MLSFCPKTAIHSLSAVCREICGRHLQVELFKISFSFLLLGLIPANPDVVTTFFRLIYTNVTIPCLHASERWFTTYFELAVSTITSNFIVKISTLDWLISKFVSKFCLGGLGSCSRTVKECKGF